jgi:predicted O-methyltransferase YrrM
VPIDPRLLAAARAAKGFMPDDEGLALYGSALVAASSGLGPILEVGTYCAKSAIYLGAAARLGGAQVFSIDHHRGSEEMQPGWQHHDPEVVDAIDGRIDTLGRARGAIEDAGLDDTVILIVGRSATVAKSWLTPLSLLFIDGGHGHDTAWEDWRSWSVRVSPGGLVAIHDVFADPDQGGRPPYELYCEALRCGQYREISELSHGSLRVLRRL